MAATEPGPAPNEYTLRRFLITYAKIVAVSAVVLVVGMILLFALLYAVFVLGPGPRASTIEGVVDGLPLAPGWTVEKTIVEETGYLGGCSRLLDIGQRCPSVTRYYLVEGDFRDAVAAMHTMVDAAGLVIDWEANPDCGTASSYDVCFLYGNIGDTRLAINVYLPGDGDDGYGIARPDRVVVRLTANHEPPRSTPQPGASP